MDAFLKQKEGSNAHLWDMVVNEVLRPIGIFHAPMLHTYEGDGRRGIPLLAFGLYPTIDDAAKIATLLQNGGKHRGQQLLSQTKLDEALYRTAARGLTYGHREMFGDLSYHMSSWFQPYHAKSGCLIEIPYMSGYGGNRVVLLPNGVTAFRFQDGFSYDIESMVLAGEAASPFCEGKSANQKLARRLGNPLNASKIHSELSGTTLYTSTYGRYKRYLAPGGVLFGTGSTGKSDIGRWRVTDSGHLCFKWNVWRNRREHCSAVYQNDDTFELYETYRWRKSTVKRKKGNPEGY